MNKLLITLLSLLTILVFLYFSGIVSFYSQTLAPTNFNGASSLIAFDSNGNLKSIPVSNINAGINAAVKGTADSINNVIDTVKQRANDNSYGVSNLKDNIVPTLAKKTDVTNQINAANASVNRSLNSYVKKGSPVSIQVGAGSSGYTYSTSNPRYLYGSGDNWRVAYDNTKPNAKFILN